MTNVLRQIRAASRPAAVVEEHERKPPMIAIHCHGGINRSPTALIYWLYMYAFDKAKLSEYPYDRMVHAIKNERTRLFWKAVETDGVSPVLKNKEQWMEQVKARVDKEWKQYKDINHPFHGLKRQEKCKDEMQRGRHAVGGGHVRSVLYFDCGGIPGSPFSDSDGAAD